MMNPWLLATLNVGTPVLVAFLTNGIIYYFGWNDRKPGDSVKAKASKYIPPGWAIAVIWTVILALLGFGNFLALSRHDYISFTFICAIMVACIAYPFYTSGLSNNNVALRGNAVTMLISYAASAVIASRSAVIIPCMLPLLVWITYVTVVSFMDEPCVYSRMTF